MNNYQELLNQCFVDVDGTILNRKDGQFILTPFGEFVKEHKLLVKIATFGGWNQENLSALGIETSEVLSFGDLLANDQAVIEEKSSKKLDEILVDDEDHPYTKRVVKVNSKTSGLSVMEKIQEYLV